MHCECIRCSRNAPRVLTASSSLDFTFCQLVARLVTLSSVFLFITSRSPLPFACFLPSSPLRTTSTLCYRLCEVEAGMERDRERDKDRDRLLPLVRERVTARWPGLVKRGAKRGIWRGEITQRTQDKPDNAFILLFFSRASTVAYTVYM